MQIWKICCMHDTGLQPAWLPGPGCPFRGKPGNEAGLLNVGQGIVVLNTAIWLASLWILNPVESTSYKLYGTCPQGMENKAIELKGINFPIIITSIKCMLLSNLHGQSLRAGNLSALSDRLFPSSALGRYSHTQNTTNNNNNIYCIHTCT